MPSAISHLVTGTALGYSLRPGNTGPGYWIMIALLSVVPDFDVIMFKFGIPYAHVLGHRGFFHSFLFALWLGLVFSHVYCRVNALPVKKYLHIFCIFSCTVSLHCVLDAMTNGGLGIGLLIPFDDTRYFLPWKPIQVSPIGITQFFGAWGLRVMKSELRWLIFPSLLVIISVKLVRSKLANSGRFSDAPGTPGRRT